MKHQYETRVYYSDTDMYGVAWHGSYIRWMEAARVEFCRSIGLDLVELSDKDIILPVTNININYKSSAKLDDELIVETETQSMSKIVMIFHQTIKNKQSGQVYIDGTVSVVAVNHNAKLYKGIPEIILNKLRATGVCKD